MPESLVSDDDGVETHIQLLKRCHHNNIVEKKKNFLKGSVYLLMSGINLLTLTDLSRLGVWFIFCGWYIIRGLVRTRGGR